MRWMRTPRAECVGNVTVASYQLCSEKVQPETEIWQGTFWVIAALSFLGLGSPPPTPDWGSDLNLSRDHMESRPLIAVFPGLAISYAVLAFNLFGDGLRDILDPRLAEK